MPKTITITTTHEAKLITIDKDPSEGNLDSFITQRISESELNAIHAYYEKNKAKLHHQLSALNTQESLHISHQELPRDILVYLNKQNEVCCLIQLEKYLAGKNTAAFHLDQQKLLLGAGGNREIEYVLDLHTRDIYAQTINRRAKTHAKELQLLQQLRSPYINPLTCYTQYKDQRGTLITTTVSPYQKHGILKNQTLLSGLSYEQKVKLILQLLLGVKSIHDLGKSYNDFKPSNLLIKDNLDILIIDFDGITNNHSRESFDFTYGYESPEMHCLASDFSPYKDTPPSLASQIASKDTSVTTYQHPFNHPKNDIFSLGIIIYQITHDLALPTINFVNSPREKTNKLSLLDSLAHTMLNKHRSNRPDIDQAIIQFILSITKESIKTCETELLKLDTVNTEESHSALLKQLFPGIDDTFVTMDHALQKSVLRQLGLQWPTFHKTLFYKKRMIDDEIISFIPTVDTIAQQIRHCIDFESAEIKDKKHDIQNKFVIRKAIEWIDSSDQPQVIAQLKQALSGTPIHNRLVSLYRSKHQATFQAIWLFAITFPNLLNIHFSEFILNLNEKESSEILTYIKKNFSLFDYANLITSNLVMKHINDTQRSLLGSLALDLLKEYSSQFRSVKQEQILIAASLYYGVTHYDELSIIDQQRTKSLIDHHYTTFFTDHYKELNISLSKLIVKLVDINLAIPILYRIHDKLSNQHQTLWMVALNEEIDLLHLINELIKCDRRYTVNLFNHHKQLYDSQQTALWISVLSQHIHLREILSHFASDHTELSIFNSIVKHLQQETIEEWLSCSSNKYDLIHLIAAHHFEIALCLFIKICPALSTHDAIHWIDSLSTYIHPIDVTQLHTVTDEVTPSSWTLEQRKIFALINKISTFDLPDIHRLTCLDYLFDYLQSVKHALYPKRNPRFDAIGEFFGRGESITKHRAIQLNYLRTVSFNLLSKAADQSYTEENAHALLASYEKKPLFSVHRQRGFFNAYLPTKHQTLINDALQQLKK